MESAGPRKLFYKRSHFVTHLPVDYLYSPAHSWIAKQSDGRWRVGLTQFATRMLGEMVDQGFELESGAGIDCGQIIGWVEGFKAISDIYCIAKGQFAGSNPKLKDDITLITSRPYGEGWLYEAEGEADVKCMDVNGYKEVLDATIDRMLEEQKGDEIQ